jgi:hypothetical protein
MATKRETPRAPGVRASAVIKRGARNEDDVLRAVVDRVAVLEARLLVLETARRGRPADPARLLSAIAHRFGSTVFSSRDVGRMAAIDADLRAALAGLDARRLGAQLKRLHRHGGGAPYVVERVEGREAGGALWCITVAHTEAD